MSPLRKTVHGRRRISALLFSLLRRLDRWLSGWQQQRRARWASQPASSAGLHYELLEPRLLLSADLVGGSLSHDAFPSAVPSDAISAHFTVYRPDSEPLGKPVRIQFYASADSLLDAGDTRVGQTDIAADRLNPGSNAITVSLDARAIGQPGRYTLIGVVDPDNAIAESDETNNQSIASSPLTLDFAVGQLPGRSPVPSLDLSDADGTRFTLTIAGPGLARLTPNGTGYDLNLSGTDAGTRIELAGSGGDGRITLTGLNADSPLGSLVAPLASLTGTARFGTVNSLNLGDIAAGARLEGNSLANLNVSRDALGDLRLTGGGVSGFVLGATQVGGAIAGLWTINGRANSISGESTRADWRANISSPLTQLVIRGDASGQFAASALQLLQVGGSLKAMTVRIGANLGSDAVIGGSGDAADHFGAGTLARLRVSGDIDDSLIVIGVDPHNGRYRDGDDRQLGTSTNRVQELLVGGRLTGDTQISAPAFPASVRINGVLRSPASLSELASTPPDRSAPTLVAALVNDSGTSASDRLTRDATLGGQASDAAGVTRLLAALDPAGTPSFVDLSSALQPDGRFVLTPELLDTLAGGTLTDGAHRVLLVAADAAGNASVPVDLAFTLDTQAPAAPTLDLVEASDSGASATDNLTNDATPTLALTAEAGSEIVLLRDTTPVGTGLTGPDAEFTADALADGAYTFSASARDAAGNLSATGALRLTIDTAAPVLESFALDPSSDTGTLGDRETSAAVATLLGQADPGTTITLGDSDLSTTADASGAFRFVDQPLALGDNAFGIVLTDDAGNSMAASLTITRVDPPIEDTTAPTLAAALLVDSGRSASDGITREAAISGTVSDEQGVTVLRAGFGSDLTTFVSILDSVQADGRFTLDRARLAAINGGALPDGSHTLHLRAEDAPGNRTDFDLAFTLDTTPPAAPTLDLVEASDSGASATDNLTSDATPTLALTAEAGSEIVLLRDTTPVGTGLTGPDAEFTADALADGTYTFSASARDAAGNRSATSALEFTIDTAAPILASFTLDPASDTGTLGDRETSATVATLLGQSEPGTTITLGGSDLSSTADAGGAFRFADLPLALGDNAFAIVLTDRAGNTSTGGLYITRVTPPVDDTTAPSLAADLANDTGRSAFDTLTRDAAISGAVSDEQGVTVLRAGFGSEPTTFVSILDSMQADGRFTLDRARLAAINGGALPDGSHTLRLVAADAAGNTSTRSVAFTLDTLAPTAPTFGLSLASDTGSIGDADTEAARVTLVGSGEADADLLLVESGFSGVASSSGSFFLPDVDLALGDNTFTLQAIDAAGNVAETNQVIHRSTSTTSDDLVLQWNDIALTAIRLDASAPPVATRALAMLSIAVLDTVNAVEGTPGFYVSRRAPAGASLDAAIAAAAQRVLAYLYPGQLASFDAALAGALAGIADGAAKSDGIALGRAIADDIIALRKGDGFDDFVDFTGSTAPGQWQATAPVYAVALLPQWADLQPFAMSSPSEFRPPAPPALDSATYTADFAEVKALGSATGSTRSAEQTQIARFWADGAGTDTPPGHWNRIAATLATAQGNSLAANARLFAQLNVALADASITAWDAKYHYTAWRPITAIRAADTDGNDATAADAAWTSLLITPPFPEYVSGHSTYSGAAETVLASAFGTSTGFTIDSEGLPGVERSFASVHAAAEEAGRSRIYGGIHFEYANQAGLAAGRALGQKVLDTFASHTDTQAPKLLLDQADGLVSDGNVTLGGRVLDALSGVAVLEGAFDDAVPAAIAFDADGHFSVTSALALDGSADGEHTLTLSAVDARGNFSAPVSLRFTLDTRAPEIVLRSLAEDDALSTASRLTGTADPTGSTLVSLSYAFDGGRTIPVAFDPASGEFDSVLDLAALAVGGHTLTLTARDAAGHTAVSTLNLTLPELIPLTITRTTPSDGADDVGATFRPQVVFSRPVDVTTLTSSTFYATDTTGAKLAATIVPAADGSFAWLFLTNPLPGASTITLHVVGDGILAGDGQALDADGDGTPGGTFTSRFTTVSVTPIAGTTISGRLLDPGDDLKPMTFDDIRAGADGALHTADDVFLHPIAGAKVFILGLEGNVVYTDAHGYFHLDQVPAGDVKLAIDGRTATNPPAGSFYPEMVMDLTIEVGYDNTVMGSMGTREAMAANEDRQEVYLPRLQTTILRTVSGSENTEVGVDAVSAPNLTDEQRAQLKLEVQPGTLIDADGKVMASGQVGISTVPPELVRDMLPPGVLQHTFDITIQAPGVAAFATPLAISFPNVFEAAPGTKLNFLSFDHTTGRLVIEGTATVSADGLSVTSDPGQGITKPGWHGLVPLGSFGIGPLRVNISIDPNCDWYQFLKGFSSVGLGTALLIGGSIGGSSVAGGVMIAASVANFIEAVDAQFATLVNLNKAPPPGLVVDWLEFAFDLIGFMTEDFAPPTGELARLFNKADLARLTSWHNGLGMASKAVSLLDMFFEMSDLVKFAKCVSVTSSAQINFDPLTWLPFFDGLDSASQKMLSAVKSIFGNNLADIFGAASTFASTTTRTSASVSSADIDLLDGILFATDGGRLRAFNSDGSPVPDPRTGKPLDEPIENLIDSRLATDGDFRLAFLRDFKDGVAELAAFFSDSSEPYVTLKREVNQTLNSLNGILSELPSSEPSGSMYVRVTDAMTGQLIYAGKSNDGGNFEFASPPNSIVLVEGFDPSTGSYGRIVSPTGASGQTYGVRSIGAVEVIEPGDTPLSPLYGPQPLIAIPDPGPDSDGDGLGDLSEGVLGTNPNLADTDGDGINDLGEIKASGDPLGGRAFPTGVVASLPLQGEAKAVTLEGSTTSAETQTAYVATGSHGLAIVDASNFQRPLVLSQLDLAGDAVDVAIDARLGIAAVASTTALHLVNVSDPSRPALVRSIPIAATQVEVADGVAYVAIGTAIESYSLLTGERLQLLPVGATNVITALARDGTTLYALDASRALHAIDISGLLMTVLGGIGVPAGTGNVFVGNGIAYIGAVNTRSSGFVTVDVSNPRAMTLLGEVSSTDVAGQAIVANGSGLAVSVGSAFTFVTGPIVNVLDVRDPTNTGSFLTSFSLAADPFDIAIGAGIAFVADGTGGLQVVNYLPFDNQGQAPTITLGAQHADQDPGTAGIQALEGSLIDLKIEVNDDQQVRNLELLVDGQVVSNDVAFPWAATVALPVRTSDKTTAVIQARVTDTGGNTTFSDALVIDLVADTFAPTIEESNVADGSRHGQSFRTVRLRFSEALDPGGISAAHFRLLDASDTAILPIDVALDRIGRIVTLTMPDLAQGAYRLVIDGDQVKDRAGNNFGSPGQVVSSFEISEATIKWTASGGGDWNDPANWDQGRVPDASDDVWLAPETGGTITLTGEVSVGTLAIWGETILSISFGTLHVAERIILAETSSITFGDGGAIAGTTVDNPMTIEGGSIEIFAYASPASLAWVRLYHTDVWLSGDHYYFGSNLLKLNGIVWLDESSITIVRGGSLVVEGQLILNGGGVNLEGIGFTRTRLGLFGSVEGYGSITVGRQRVGDYDDGTPWEEIGGSGSIGPGITTYIEGHVLVGGDFGGPLTNYGFIQVHAHAQCTITASLINEGAIGVVEGSTLDDPLGLISGNEPFYIYLELLVDAQVVTNDVAFPWTATVTLPARTPDKATAVIQARVTDTGGNTTLSDVLVIDLVADTFAPTIEDSNVADSSRHGQSFRTVRLRFSEALDLGGISAAHFRLLDASDTTILPIDVALDSRGQIVTLTMPELAQGAYWLVIDGDHVTDRTGNAFGSADQVISGFEISEATIKWLAPSLNRRHSCIDFGVHLSSTRKTAATKSLSGANLGGTAAAAAIQGASPRLIRS